ncbi:hypothetical protein ACKI1I_10580 [Streptomyces turgidiscabies]|uniref:Gram-positive signal peptide protein, YSIRK family n=1 Tax=Streptomyces turgidiscabies (strain Car8) TaxID=698760 RepID=L7FJH6_STRT8|nr:MULTISPECIES: hypothetical protein [Streptomyces]ELP70860.1 Gram-positive signal peptide protein, YSIRK family [Streptomyces turgidiscabies Car8]MDX3497544.1 hypothetical protein [Streptomyces turgidiscabies]GAQ72164.1 hypothetical protein T45_03909 [Streptomyces turgidiscabies]
MNTERPDHDDDAADGDAEKTATGADTDGSADDVTEPAPEESGAERPSRRRSPVLVASVAAAVLLVGGGGAYLATSAVGGSKDDDRTGASAPGGDGTTPPPLALDGYTESGDTGGTGGTNGIAPGEPDPNGVTYRADGALPAGPSSAPVYTMAKNAEGEITAAEVTRLAKALGVEGKPVTEAEDWLVGTAKDGTGPFLRVNKHAPGTWSFRRYLLGGPDNCRSTTVCAQKPSAEGTTVDPVSEAAAKKAAAPVLKAVGQDDAKLDVSQVLGTQRVVNADPVVGGLPTYGWTTGLQISAQGEVVSGSGQLSTPVKSDTYPVLGAKATLALLNEPGAVATPEHRMGIGGCASPVPLKDRLEAPCGTTTETTTRQKESLTVDKAVFGLASHTVAGRPALVPSWLFEVRAQGAVKGHTVTYPAVDPRFLAGAGSGSGTSAEPSPTATPTAPGDEPTSGTTTRNMKIEGYTVSGDGKELTVGFWGGVCSTYAASAKEDGEVTVTVTSATKKGTICIMLAKATYEKVQLDEPLGDRKVVGPDGQTIAEGDFAKR